MAGLQKWLDLAATIAVILMALGVLGNIGVIRRTGSPQAQTRRPEPSVTAAPVSLKGDNIEGDPRAPLAVIEYSDFQCPFCGTFAREVLPDLREKYVRTGKALLAFRHLPLPSHQFAKKAAQGAECAAKQGRFWEMHDQLFLLQSSLSDERIRAIAQRMTLDVNAFDKCVDGGVATKINESVSFAGSLGISATPTFLIGTVQPDNTVKVFRVITGLQAFEQFQSVLSSVPERASN